MNDKLALQDLVEVLSKKAKITKKEADLFFRELFQLILDRIFENDSVKIKDFGTFKLTSVSSRESVNVNTGEKIEIPAHLKLSFLPDKTLKNLVNKPFSQFETILLEDGIISDSVDLDMDEEDDFESFQENNESEDLSSEMNIDEVSPISDSEAQNRVEEVSTEVIKPANQNMKENSDSSKETSISQPRINNPYSSKSFVYTYTTSSSDDNEVITLTLPKQDLLIKPDVTHGIDLEVEEKEIELESQAEELVQEIEKTKAQEETIPVSEITTAENKVIDNNHTDILEDELGLDSEIETEEDVVMSPVIELKKNPDISKSSSLSSVSSNSRIPIQKDIDDPERPLVPLDESIDEIASDRDMLFEQEENSVHNTIGRFNDSSIGVGNVEYSDAVYNVDSNIPYYDYNKPTLGAQIMKRLPIIIFIAIIVCFSIYAFVKLFDVQYDYEYYLGNKNLTLADTLPLVNERPEAVELPSDTLSTSANLEEEIEKNQVGSSQSANKGMIVASDTIKPTQLVNNANIADNKTDIDKSGRIISDRLRIDVVNKGAFHVNKLPKSGLKQSVEATIAPVQVPPKNAVQEKQPASKAVYVTMQRGATLRTMATKYYGDATYWVYIYQANRIKLSNPNDISVGMKILVPDLANYGVTDVKSTGEIQKAKRLGDQLLKW